MKHYTYLLLAVVFLLSAISCQSTKYQGALGNTTTTHVELNNANFNVLGSFIGVASAKKVVWSIKDRAGLISEAKKDLLEEAKKAGVELTGARALINFTVDIIENRNRITCSVSAEIIEFTK